ncbi:MAG: T9SS type A sorting domain-containing protein, partial [Bacteroidota bacterium]
PFRIGQQSYISGNPALQNLNGLAGVTQANLITVRLCHALTDLSGLGGVTQINDININNNYGLTSLNGLNPNLDIANKLTVVGNLILSDCAITAVCSHLEDNGNNFITSNPAGCANANDILSNCSTECGDSVTETLRNQNEVDAFANTYSGCSIFEGEIIIDEDSTPAITNLNGLSALREVNQLRILNAPQLMSFDDLSSLKIVHEDLDIRNTAITQLDDLAALTEVGLNLIISDNSSLTSVTDFSTITLLGRNLTILNNPLLTDLSGFNNLETVGDVFSLINNASLASLTDFSNLRFASDGLTIDNNDLLTNLAGLEALENINSDLKIANNDLLTDISALTNLDQTALINTAMVSGRLVIDNNPLLGNCAINTVCNLLEGAGVSINIQNNATACADESTVQTACAALLPVEFVHFSAIAAQGQAKLRWQTATETNNEGFEIERSADGRSWVKIGFVPGQGTTTRASNYEFVDENPGAISVFYRLRQEDYDGRFAYSPLRQVSFGKETEQVLLYPNPVQDILHLQDVSSELREVIVSNPYGQQFRLAVVDGSIHVHLLPAGTYFLRTEESGMVLRFVKR